MTPADSLEVQLNTDLQSYLRDYAEFKLCRELKCMPETLREQPADRVFLWHSFLSAESKAEDEMMRKARRGGV